MWAQDVDLRYLWIFNPSMGLSAEGMVGKTDHDVLDGPTAERLTTLKRKAMNTGEGMCARPCAPFVTAMTRRTICSSSPSWTIAGQPSA
ncbi:hypothetical protein [Roseitalea porphyridii]|uniref:hypothetical protein n=1 Tax=Roseitalea porphyridii TaxID=1852022 RepID=UPI0032EB48AF